MALIDIHATIKGSAVAAAVPIRIITASAAIKGEASSGQGRPAQRPQTKNGA